MATKPRIADPHLRSKIMSAEDAAALILPGTTIGMSGFTGAGYPKAVPLALAQRIEQAHRREEPFQVKIWTGASTAPELDGALAKADGIELRLPYQSDPICRSRINDGRMEYLDMHLSHVAQAVWEGFLGHLDVAVVEVTAIRADGQIVPSSSVGNNKTWLDCADKVILEVNSWQPEQLEGMHDIYYGTRLPPHRRPIMLVAAGDRIGNPYLNCPPEKIIAVVETDTPDRNSVFAPADEISQRIANHILDFLEHEIRKGRLTPSLLPLQSGVGNIANAVMAGLAESRFEGMTAFTEVLQDGMLHLIDIGKLKVASTTALSLSPDATRQIYADLDHYRSRIVLRPQEISNHPEVIRRLGCLAMNGMIEADIYGNVNSTHVMGTRIQNGIGGSGDFARNAYISFFMTPSMAKGGAISCIVPMVSHVDHTEHDVHVIVTEQGLADLRGLSPKQRAEQVIEHCAHPDVRPALRDYHRRALSSSAGKHTPHLLDEAFSWHLSYLRDGKMPPSR
ncbi:MAG: acetyl-CoA hydrolase/transferase family protein [Oscillochloris sp.]|nr:acetyl-CoA hydrolase/transferase family protein [Oscillochloris sp.]